MSLPANELRDVPGYEGIYAVTRDGKVWSHPRAWVRNEGRKHPGRWLRATLDSSGYPKVTLTVDGKVRCVKVHRLVALTWIGPPPTPTHEVNHVDGVKANAAAANLEWVTRRENMNHAIEHGLLKAPTITDGHRIRVRALGEATRKVSIDQASEIRALVAGGMKKSQAGRLFGLTYWSVRDICAGKTYRAA